MRVLLVRPRRLNAMTVFGAVDCEPLELEYLSAACKAMGRSRFSMTESWSTARSPGW